MTSSHSLSSAIYRLFFADGFPEDRKLSPGAKYLIVLAFFTVTRVATWVSHDCSDIIPLTGNTDPAGYIAVANYITQHGHLSLEDDQHYRQFAGLPLLMAALNPLVGNMATTGYLIVITTALGSLALMQRLFDNLRLTLISSVFLPYWVISTTTIYAEAPAVLCFLIGVWVLRDFRERPILLSLGILVAGYSLVIRPPSLFLAVPTLALIAWRLPGGNLSLSIRVTILLMLPFAIYLGWNWLTIHQLFPQGRLQSADMEAFRLRNPDPNHYTVQEFNFPFRGIVEGLTDPWEKISKKISVVGSIATAIVALVCATRMAIKEGDPQRRALATGFAAALFLYLLFHSMLWPLASYKYIDRYLSGANVVIDWAIFLERPLRWPWILALAIGGVIFAAHMGGYQPFGGRL